jgi:hypothetical protein
MKIFAFLSVLIVSGMWSGIHAQVTNQKLPSAGDHFDIGRMNSTAEGSAYVPVDNWIYPALDRLYALGYVDSAYLGLRPWTRRSIAHMLELSADRIETDRSNDEARGLYLAVQHEIQPDIDQQTTLMHPRAKLEMRVHGVARHRRDSASR